MTTLALGLAGQTQAQNKMLNFSNRAIGIIHFEKLFQTFIADSRTGSLIHSQTKTFQQGLSVPEFYGDLVYFCFSL